MIFIYKSNLKYRGELEQKQKNKDDAKKSKQISMWKEFFQDLQKMSTNSDQIDSRIR